MENYNELVKVLNSINFYQEGGCITITEIGKLINKDMHSITKNETLDGYVVLEDDGFVIYDTEPTIDNDVRVNALVRVKNDTINSIDIEFVHLFEDDEHYIVMLNVTDFIGTYDIRIDVMINCYD